MANSLRSLGRFSETAFHVLWALEDGPKHGYAMTLAITEMTGHRPGPAVLYGAITRLDERKWIEPLSTDDDRRPYRLTPVGRQVMREQLAALPDPTTVPRPSLTPA